MKIRSITLGTDLDDVLNKDKSSKLFESASRIKGTLINKKLPVQSIRLTTQYWNRNAGRNSDGREHIEKIKELEERATEAGFDFISLGTIRNPRYLEFVPEIIEKTNSVSCSSKAVLVDNSIDLKMINETARTILEISRVKKEGMGNFSFALIVNCPPHTPFYPASYHQGKPWFSIAVEGSSMIALAFTESTNHADAEEKLYEIMTDRFSLIEKSCRKFDSDKLKFKGIDLSPAPSLEEKESLAYSSEKIINGKFGEPGTLFVSGMITSVINRIDVKKCGYSGLMLPILEDRGLALRYDEESFDLNNLLLYSSVCGTGLDCIPLPGNTPVGRIEALLMDVATQSYKLEKPLSARLLPIPGKKAGERTGFESPYLINTRIRKI